MLSVDRPSTECRPITDRYIGQVSTNHRPTISEVLAKCLRNVGEVSVNEKLYRPRHIWNDYRPCLYRVSTHYWPTIDRYVDRVSTEYRPSVDRVSTDCRPSVDRLSTECWLLYRPLYRPICRSTLPTVNKIQYFFPYRKSGAKVVYMSSNKTDNHPLKCTLPITGHNNEVKYLEMNNFTVVMFQLFIRTLISFGSLKHINTTALMV